MMVPQGWWSRPWHQRGTSSSSTSTGVSPCLHFPKLLPLLMLFLGCLLPIASSSEALPAPMGSLISASTAASSFGMHTSDQESASRSLPFTSQSRRHLLGSAHAQARAPPGHPYILTIGDSNDMDTLIYFCHWRMKVNVCRKGVRRINDTGLPFADKDTCNAAQEAAFSETLRAAWGEGEGGGEGEGVGGGGQELNVNYCLAPEGSPAGGTLLASVMHQGGAALLQLDAPLTLLDPASRSALADKMAALWDPRGNLTLPLSGRGGGGGGDSGLLPGAAAAGANGSGGTGRRPAAEGKVTQVEAGLAVLHAMLPEEDRSPDAVVVHAAFWDLNLANDLGALRGGEWARPFLQRYALGVSAMMTAVRRMVLLLQMGGGETGVGSSGGCAGAAAGSRGAAARLPVFFWRTANPCTPMPQGWLRHCDTDIVAKMNGVARRAAAQHGYEVLDLEAALRGEKDPKDFLHDQLHFNYKWQDWYMKSVLDRLLLGKERKKIRRKASP